MASKEETRVDADTANVEVDFKEISVEKAFDILKCTHKGLTSDEAKRRLEEYGPNKLPEDTKNPFFVFLGYMWNPLSWAMEAAAIIAIALLDYADFALIVALLITNATISFVEESNADKAIKALTAALAPKAKALRDGQVVTVEAADLVPGDVIIVRLGDIVAADIKLLGEEDEQPMQIDQAALTGESLPVKKGKGDVAFAGSTVKQGERHAVVYATGLNTFFGRAAALLGQAEQVANLQKIMTKIGAMCLITIGVWVAIELGVQFGHYGHKCKGGAGGCPTLTNMLVIVVGGIPIAMPTVLSVTLALGAFKLAKEGAIVSRMSAVEEMAGMDILCSDKTGTLTLNKLTVDISNVYPVGDFTIEDVLRYGAASANIVTEEPIDMVLYNSYAGKDTLWTDNKIIKFIPFNPTDKYTVAYVQENATGKVERIMKGAPQVVVRATYNRSEIEAACNEKIVEYANRGFRALGIARAEGEGPVDDNTKWEMIGLVPLFDPPRHDTKETIERCLEMGIHVKMITGDQLLIGKETARQLGMGQNMFTTEVLLKAKAGTELVAGTASVEELVEHADGFAEVFPEHKFMIVKILQELKHVCGMTGDGVNDAPALKKADVGIAVAGATDAARGAADIVLTEAGLSTIVTAVIGARKIFQRMTTYAKYTVAMTFRICFTFGLLTVIYNWYFPTILIVLLAVFNDGAMIALSKDRVVPSHMPNRWDLNRIFIQGIFYGLYLTLATWVLFYVATHMHFFEDKIGMFSLNYMEDTLTTWCTGNIRANFPAAYTSGAYLEPGSICAVPQYAPQFSECNGWFGDSPSKVNLPSMLQQCMAEQEWMRHSMTRSLIYVYVSVSGQALVFVVRTLQWSIIARAGVATYIAFIIAQFASTMIGLFGFNGYETPNNAVSDCQFCRLSSGGRNPFFSKNEAPLYGTEDTFIASCIGCTYYVVVAWIWAIIWHFGLDPLKWLLAYFMNEDGIRQGSLWDSVFFQKGQRIGASIGLGVTKHPEMMRASVQRVSLSRLSGGAGGAPAGAPPSALERISALMLTGSVPSRAGHPSAGGVQVGNRFTGGVPGVGGSMVPSPAMLERASMVRVSAGPKH